MSTVRQEQLTELSEADRSLAMNRYEVIRLHIEDGVPLTRAAAQSGVKIRTARRWLSNYQELGLAGLARKPRKDKNQRKLAPELEELIIGLVLSKTKPSTATIYRQVLNIASKSAWKAPSYNTVLNVVNSIDPDLLTLAQEGTKVYQNTYDLIHTRKSSGPNKIWQADHALLPIWLKDDNGQSRRPWLTIIEDDFSRAIAGYYLTFENPNAFNTALTLHQAIWSKPDHHWRICGIPDRFYTDHGSDFTSKHMEQVAADLKMQLIFSIPGAPRGRGRIERFFRTVNDMFLQPLPGYGDKKPLSNPALTLLEIDERFHAFLINDYHQNQHRGIQKAPLACWEEKGFLPRMPESLEELDLLLLTVATTRRVRQDGIHFQTFRYFSPTLAGYVGEDVVIRYDPRDMASIRIFHENTFLCNALCQELADQIVTLKEITSARNKRRRELRKQINESQNQAKKYLESSTTISPDTAQESDNEANSGSKKRKLKLYYNE